MRSHENPIDMEDIATLLGVEAQTVRAWRIRRNGLPPESGYISGSPYWYREDIIAWATETGRWGREKAEESETTHEPVSGLTDAPVADTAGIKEERNDI